MFKSLRVKTRSEKLVLFLGIFSSPDGSGRMLQKGNMTYIRKQKDQFK